MECIGLCQKTHTSLNDVYAWSMECHPYKELSGTHRSGLPLDSELHL